MVFHDCIDWKHGPNCNRSTDPDKTLRGSPDTKHHHGLTSISMDRWQYNPGPSTYLQAATQSMCFLSPECIHGSIFCLSHLLSYIFSPSWYMQPMTWSWIGLGSFYCLFQILLSSWCKFILHLTPRSFTDLWHPRIPIYSHCKPLGILKLSYIPQRKYIFVPLFFLHVGTTGNL